MRMWLWCLTLLIAFALAGCGGESGGGSGTNPNAPFNGIYRTSFTRGTSAITVYVNSPAIEIVISDEANVFTSYVGASSSAVTTSGSNTSFSAVALTGSDGEVASATGTFVSGGSSAPNSINLSITGGIGFSGTVSLSTTTTNNLYTGTYSGPFTSNYQVGAAGSPISEPAGSISSLTLQPSSSTGGYTLNATGTTTDPTGNPVNFAITNAAVDPAGIISNLQVVFSYSNGTTPSVTNTYPTAYINLGVVSTTTLTGFITATTTSWPDAAFESDTFTLTQSSTSASKAKGAKNIIPVK